MIAPVLVPKQFTWVWVLVKVKAAAGWVIVIVAVAVQLLASVTVTVYDPALILFRSSVDCPPDQLKVYGAVPPVGFKFIAPVLVPKQFTLVWVLVNVKAAAGWVIVIVAVAVQPFVSVAVTIYVPEERPLRSSVVEPPVQL